MFWVRICLGGRNYLGVLDTGATISIVAKKILPCGALKNILPAAAIRMGDGHVVHSCGDCEVEVPMGSRSIAHRFYMTDTKSFDFVLGTDFYKEKAPSRLLDYKRFDCHKNERLSVRGCISQKKLLTKYLITPHHKECLDINYKR